jgi:nucleoside diphosphate kinase
LACKGLLIEEFRTNYIVQSENFNLWLTTGGVVSRNKETTILDPAGTFNSRRVEINATFSIYQDGVLGVPDGQHSVSIFARAVIGGLNSIKLQGSGVSLIINLADGGVVSNVGTVAGSLKVERFGDIGADGFNWWRISFAPSNTVDESLYISNGATVSGAITAYLIWGAQYELGSFATSYIPTTTAALARSVDVCSITGANFTSFYNQSEGTIIGQGIVDTVGVGLLFPSFANFNDGTANNRVVLGATNSGGTAVRPIVAVAGSTVFSNSIGTSSAGQSRKVGMVYKQNDFIAAHNGTLTAADNTGNIPTAIDRVSFDANFFVGTIAAIRYYKKRLPNAKLQAITA